MTLRDRLGRLWAHRRLYRGRCDWCWRPLPDTGSVDPRRRACSQECSDELWLSGEV
jgi:hypothetical protein